MTLLKSIYTWLRTKNLTSTAWKSARFSVLHWLDHIKKRCCSSQISYTTYEWSCCTKLELNEPVQVLGGLLLNKPHCFQDCHHMNPQTKISTNCTFSNCSKQILFTTPRNLESVGTAWIKIYCCHLLELSKTWCTKFFRLSEGLMSCTKVTRPAVGQLQKLDEPHLEFLVQ